MARIPVSIWRDPEFTGLSRQAQYLWFLVKTSKIGERQYSPYAVVEISSMELGDVLNAEIELRSTSYSSVFIPRKARPYIPAALRREVLDRDRFTCQGCGSTDELTLDHIYPYSLGGEDTLQNLHVLCRSCNSRKGATVP